MLHKLLFLVPLFFISPCHSTQISLSGNDWTISDNNYTVSGGTIPGSIHTILLKAGKIPDPYLGFNDINLRYLVENDWTFTKKFNLSSDFLQFNSISIHFEQIDTIANISLNGCPIGKTANMFLRYIFEVPKTCIKAENDILIQFQSPVTYALEQAIAYNNTYHEFVPPSCPAEAQKGICHVQFIRKEPCSFSWDWVKIDKFKNIFI
jgi:beta-mannosidase